MRHLINAVTLAIIATPVVADDAALLIGAERYENLSRIASGADTLGAADTLRGAGYNVEVATNPSASDLRQILTDFAVNTEEADRLVVGLSGHFANDQDRNWFLGTDAEDPALFDMGSTAVSLESIMAVMAQKPGQAVLVLGATDDDDEYDGFLSEGLTRIDPPQGVTVLITQPRYVDDALVDAIAAPEMNVMEYVSDNRRVAAYGYTPATLIMQPDAVPLPRATPLPSIDASQTAWNNAQDADSADSYRDFVLRYPDSQFAQEAARRLDVIENDPVRIARLAEEDLELTRTQRRSIQQHLTLLNFDTRGVDGIFGPGTRTAIRNWQQVNGYAQTSFLDAEQINRLDAQASSREAEIETEEEQAREDALRQDRAYWEQTGARGDQAGYRAYLSRFPYGIYAEEAKRNLIEPLERDGGPLRRGSDEGSIEDELNINPMLARVIETRLSQQGFNPGSVDGQFDNDTRRAIQLYQDSNSLPATGFVNEVTLARLLADAILR